MRLSDVALAVLGTARLTRLITLDSLPEDLVIGRLRRRAAEQEARAAAERADLADWLRSRGPDGERSARRLEALPPRPTALSTLVKGADCEWCWGFWAGVSVLGTYAAARRTGTLGAWRFAVGTLALNVAANGAARVLGTYAEEETPDVPG